ncbi:hypothetical protein BROUX41_002177 [Berkeleyomyces rouxiae]|uniref:uncharacterized protein n=1 Tax=Berkeleyomyces rouxiae TaxID=2035830 RepID=UPI003B7E6A90
MAPFRIEVPVFQPAHAAAALAAGAHRIELNRSASYPAGGLTPSAAECEATISSLVDQAALRIMVRPRGPPAALSAASDFTYTADELASMHCSIQALAPGRHGPGFVFGCLAAGAPDRLDVAANVALVQAAAGAPCTLHRAVDQVLAAAARESGDAGVRALVDQIVACGFAAVLTSGGPGRAVDNGDVLRVFCEAARGRLEVVVGGGVRSGNVAGIISALGDGRGVVLHSSCLVDGEFSKQELQRLLESTGN